MNRRPEANNNNNENQVAGAEAGRFDMNQMVERLREFLINIEQNFPAAAANPDNNQNNGQDDEHELDEFD